MTKFEEFCNEIEAGPFSILSTAAKDRIKTMILKGMEDAYDRGKEAAKEAVKSKVRAPKPDIDQVMSETRGMPEA